MAAAEPDVPSGAGGFLWDFVILETERVQSLEALDLLTLRGEREMSRGWFIYDLLVVV